jgi:hypothetical protein
MLRGEKSKEANMLKDILKVKLWVAILLSGIFIFSSFPAFAWEHHGDRYHFRENRWYRSGWFGFDVAVSALALGAVVASLPGGYSTVVVGGMPYYYYDDIYYRPAPDGYVVVERPVVVEQPVVAGHPATVVNNASIGYQPVVIDGKTYYVNNGVYYIYTSYGYQVVQPPAGAQNPPAPVAVTAPAKDAASSVKEEPLVINVPNKQGGFTPVKLTKQGNGYVGPQGEYYERPTVNQLKALYGE